MAGCGDGSIVTVATRRLDLVAASAAIARAEARRAPAWWRVIGAQAPPAWPPPFNDAASAAWFATALEHDPAAIGWYTWYVVERTDAGRGRILGNAGFTGRPDAHGSVEIGYALLPMFQGLGYGTELASALVAWAFAHDDVQRVIAVTYPDLIASIRVLEKTGFAPTSRTLPMGAINFELRRSMFARHIARLQAADRRPQTRSGLGPDGACRL
jgi:RimJ/RimL family protein N-acetyltransferase